MKTINLLLSVAVFTITLFLSSCNKNEEVIHTSGKQDVTFYFTDKSVSGVKGLKKVISTSKTDAKYMVISIENAVGTKVYDAKKIELYNFNGSFISEPISLDISQNAYKLTQFLVLDANNVVIYCTPTKDVSLANLISHPLPISFTVAKDQTCRVTPEVVPSSSGSTSDFGYSSFDFSIVDCIKFTTCVQILDSTKNNYVLTSADVSITGNDTTVLFSGDVSASTKTIVLKDGFEKYTITASKPGYETKAITLTNADVKTYCNNPLIFSLPIRENPLSAMAVIVTKVGTTLKYQFVLGTEYVTTNLTINSVRIYDTNGVLKMTTNSGINQPFSIASLPSGFYYILKVDVANSAVFSKMFAK